MDLWRRALSLFAVLILLGAAQPALAQNTSARTGEAADLAGRAQNTIEILQPLLDVEANLISELATITDAEVDDPDAAQSAELAQLREDLQDVQEQISVLITGVSEEGYRALDDAEFDLNSEMQQLIEPFILLLNQATSDARELERTRRDLDIANQRLANANTALASIEATLQQDVSPAVLERLNASAESWQERQASHRTQVEALTRRLSDLQSETGPVGQNVNSAFQGFFQERGISLIMGLAAFLGVLIGSRLLAYAGRQVMSRRKKARTFAMRLGVVLFAVFSLVAAIGAMVWVFNMRNDWLLLGLALLLLIAAAWVTFKMLPSLLEQLSVLLNLGAVQEGERVLFNGVPFKVQRLSFFTDLVNPALDGGQFTLPVRELVGMHSRPAAEDEAWFPSEKGDWVQLSDDNAGQVVAQTPEMVVVELLGGARVTYQTTDYLAATPVNLSNGYRVEVEFGVGYKHQDQSTDTIIDQLRDGVAAHFAGLLTPAELRNVDVEFLRAGASSLDYEVEIDVAGSAAHRFEELERELARCLVRLATQHGWEIPFQQVVIHNPEVPTQIAPAQT